MSQKPHGYEFPVFLSYRHNPYYDKFYERVHVHLEGHLAQHLGGDFNPCSVFRDTEFDGTGYEAAQHLSNALARSAVIVALIAPSYYGPQSPYTVVELDHMMWRKDISGCQSPLVFPLVITKGDLDRLPTGAKNILRYSITEYTDGNLRMNTKKDRDLGEAIKDLAIQIAEAVRNAPEPDSDWLEDCQRRMRQAQEQRILEDAPQQRKLLRLGGALK